MISNELYIFLCISSILGLLLGFISVIIASYAAIKVTAMEKSTHTMTYIDPLKDEPDTEDKQSHTAQQSEKDPFTPDWATSGEFLEKDTEKFREQLREEMPQFHETDEERKVYSF